MSAQVAIAVLVFFVLGVALGFVAGFFLERMRNAFGRWNDRRRVRRFYHSNR